MMTFDNYFGSGPNSQPLDSDLVNDIDQILKLISSGHRLITTRSLPITAKLNASLNRHKAQGSDWLGVLIINKGWRTNKAKRRCTTVTHARSNAKILTDWNGK